MSDATVSHRKGGRPASGCLFGMVNQELGIGLIAAKVFGVNKAKLIPVAAIDFPWVMQHRWFVNRSGYVVAHPTRNGKRNTLYLHRALLSLHPNDGLPLLNKWLVLRQARARAQKPRRLPISLIGKRFGQLTVIAISYRGRKSWFWICRCDCGTECVRAGSSLTRGDSNSCGCLTIRAMHGHRWHNGRESPTYNSWAMMKKRCSNPNRHDYVRYGGRGIRVCERWMKFESFLADMGERPQGTSLDRYPNNDGDYEPSNCRWATPAEQQRNRTKRQHLTFQIRFPW